MKRLFVGNLPYRTDENEVQEWFEHSGVSVSAVSVIRDRMTGESRGFGFAEVEDQDVERAIALCNGQILSGRTIIVGEARPNPADRANRPAGGYAGTGYQAR